VVADLGYIGAEAMGGEEIRKVAHRVRHYSYRVWTFPLACSTYLVAADEVLNVAGAKTGQSKRSLFTKLIFGAKIDIVSGG